MAILKVSQFVTITQDKEKLHMPLDFELSRGEILWVRGDNGSGKTTFLKTLIRQNKRYTGTLEYLIRPDQIAYLPQVTQPHFFIPLHLHDLLEKKDFNLLAEEQLHRNWNTASGGERQKTLLIKIFNQEADLYLLDEPTNQLDQEGRRLLKEKIDELGKTKAVVIVCHDENFMKQFTYKEIQLRAYGA